ncbi:MAG: hypothetical protein AABX03_03290 [Nanoarchaeota archaeon]
MAVPTRNARYSFPPENRSYHQPSSEKSPKSPHDHDDYIEKLESKYQARVKIVSGKLQSDIDKEVRKYEQKINDLQNSPRDRHGSIKKIQRSIKNLKKLEKRISYEVKDIPNKPFDPNFGDDVFNHNFKRQYPISSHYFYSHLLKDDKDRPFTYLNPKKHHENNPRFIKAEMLSQNSSKKDLTSRLSSIITIAGFVGGIFFLSSNITGNVIGNITNSTSNFLGAGLLIVSLVAGFFWLKRR